MKHVLKFNSQDDFINHLEFLLSNKPNISLIAKNDGGGVILSFPKDYKGLLFTYKINEDNDYWYNVERPDGAYETLQLNIEEAISIDPENETIKFLVLSKEYPITSYTNLFSETFSTTSNKCSIIDITPLSESNINEESKNCFWYTFDGCDKLTEIDFGKYIINDNSDVICPETFQGCTSLINFKQPDYKITTSSLNGMFKNCISLKEIDLSNFVNNKFFISFKSIFENCSSLESFKMFECKGEINEIEPSFIIMTSFNGNSSFKNCNNLKTVDLSNISGYFEEFDITNMFNGCTNLESVIIIPIQVLSENILLEGIFDNCTSLKEIDLSFLGGTIKKESIFPSFKTCTALEKFTLGNEEIQLIIENEIVSLSTFFKNSKDGGHMYSDIKELNLINCNFYKIGDFNLTYFPFLEKLDIHNSIFDGNFELNNYNWGISNTYENTLKYIDLSNVYLPQDSTSGLLRWCNKLTDENIKLFNSCLSGDLSGFFEGCSQIVNMDLSDAYWSPTSMCNTFYNCGNLEYVNVSNFNFDTDRFIYYPEDDNTAYFSLRDCFADCPNLKHVSFKNCDLRRVCFANIYRDMTPPPLDNDNWDGVEITEGYYAFRNCPSLKSLDLSYCQLGYYSVPRKILMTYEYWEVAYLNEPYYRYYDSIDQITELNMDMCDISSVDDLSVMFAGATNIKELNLNHFKVCNEDFYPKPMNGMFSGCNNLQKINFGANNIEDYEYPEECPSVISYDIDENGNPINVLYSWSTPAKGYYNPNYHGVETSRESCYWGTFEGCTSLATLEGQMTEIRENIDFSCCPLDRESAIMLINGLQDLPTDGYVYVKDDDGKLTISNITGNLKKERICKYIAFSPSTFALLTEEDIKIATDKHWVVRCVEAYKKHEGDPWSYNLIEERRENYEDLEVFE